MAGAARPPVVVMGVAGVGKSAVGRLLAEALGADFVDADDLHPPANVARMAAGVPLDDGARAPWLRAVGDALVGGTRRGRVVACSALRRDYRDQLLDAAPDTLFVHLVAAPEVLSGRLERRRGHFMPAALLGSQLATLEPLGADEPGASVSAEQPLHAVVADAVVAVRGLSAAG